MQEVKKSLRKELIARRRSLSADYKEKAEADIFEKIRPLLDRADIVFTYCSTEIEVGTRRIIAYCLEKGIKVALPVSGDTQLAFYCINSVDELQIGRYGIDEPVNREVECVSTERSVCIVPALCADGYGARLGYGKGYYDRYLTDFRGLSVIICYDEFCMEVPCETHDVRADMTIFNN